MAELKSIIAKNIAELRISRSMTQLDLAEKLHYTDKAVSKWERAESIPEISTLISIADFFGVTLDYLVKEEHDEKTEVPAPTTEQEAKRKARNRAIISAMSVLLAWFVALLVYVIVDLASSECVMHWVAFLYAVPVSMLLALIFNSIWFERRRNYLIISLMLWSLLFAIHITLLGFGHNFWQFYLFGIPGQIVIILWSKLKPAIK